MALPSIKIDPSALAYRAGFTVGVIATAKQFAPHAGRLLRGGDGSVMATLNSVMRAVAKMIR